MCNSPRTRAPFAALAFVPLLAACTTSSPESAAQPAPEPAVTDPAPSEPTPATDPRFAALQARQNALRERQAVLLDRQLALGTRLLEHGRLREALAAFRRALDLAPDHGDARRLHDLVLTLLGEPSSNSQGETRATWETTRLRLQQMSLIARQHLRRGHHHRLEGEFDRALEEYRNALLIFEVNPQADAAFDVKQLKRAIADCERARAAALRRAEARRIREVAALLREEDARDRRRAAAKINTLWLEANRLYDRGEYGACERLCWRIMELDPAGGPARRR